MSRLVVYQVLICLIKLCDLPINTNIFLKLTIIVFIILFVIFRMFSVKTKKSSCCKSVHVTFKLLKYLIYNVLRIVFDIAARVTLKCSYLFERLSNNLETCDIMEELTKDTLKNW